MTRTYRTDTKGKKSLRKTGFLNNYWWRHDETKTRRQLNRTHRHHNKHSLRKFGETIPYFKERGFASW